MPTNDIEYKIIKPYLLLADYIERFFMIINHSENDKEIVVLPDGIIDIFFSYSLKEPFSIMLYNFDREAKQFTLASKTVTFAINFKLLAVEYILNMNVANIPNNKLLLPDDFWNITQKDLADFDCFVEKVSKKMHTLLAKKTIDERKRKLFKLIYSSKGSMTVKEMSEKSSWSSREINRYFNKYFGLSLKTYCNIVRFRASFEQIRNGKLYPELSYADQAHFIRETKKLSSVQPKELLKNKNDRFIQFLTLPLE